MVLCCSTCNFVSHLTGTKEAVSQQDNVNNEFIEACRLMYQSEYFLLKYAESIFILYNLQKRAYLSNHRKTRRQELTVNL